MTSSKILAKNVLWSLLGRIAPLAAAIFSIPAIIEGLGTDRFGVLTLVWMLIGYFSLFDMGIGRALTKMISDKIAEDNKEDILSIIWTGLIFMLIFGVIGASVGVLFASPIINTGLKIPAGLKPDTLTTFYLLVFSIPIVIMTNGLRGILEAYQRFDIVNAVNIPMGLFIFLAPLGVLAYSRNLVPIVATLVAGRCAGVLIYFGSCCYVIPEMRHRISFRTDMIGPLIKFGGWLTITNIIGPLLVYLDRFMIGAFVSMAYVAYYTTPYEVITKLWIIPGSIVAVLFPAFALSFKEDRDRMAVLFFDSIKHIYLILFPVTLIIVCLSHDLLNLWLGREFADNSARILQWLATGVFINSIAQIPYTLIQSTGRPDITAKLHLIELPIYLLTLWYMLAEHGIQGAAIAWTIRLGIDTALLFWIVLKLFPEKITANRIRNISQGGILALIIFLISALISALFLKMLFLLFVLAISAILYSYLLFQRIDQTVQ